VGPGTLLILATDGIDSGFASTLSTAEPAQLIADTILARHARQSDDALALVVRFRGGP
jgi:negative regulator of sigma-B (phosphoserine phosphatase)